ncbi:exodeoxyribonuclease VII large subunit [Bacteroidota bacterium]
MKEYTLSELNSVIKECLEANLEPSYWVIAEIGELRVNQNGHCYLELIEKSGDEVLAKINATIWSYTYRNLSGWFEAITGENLQLGLKIMSNVVIQFHEVYGLSLNIKDINPNFTLGERARRRAEIIEQLSEDGVIDMNRELSLPLVPQRVALISSPTAAGYQDFVDQLINNDFSYKFKVELFSSLMQGDEASQSIIEALLEINQQIDEFDVVAIIRGGGSATDLDCFDSYDLASHVAQFPLPVITGIGHERDETIVDLVANSKMKTPTAVAEFLVYGLNAFEAKIDSVFDHVDRYTHELINDNTLILESLQGKVNGLNALRFEQFHNHLEKLESQIIFRIKLKLQQQGSRLEELTNKITNVPLSYLDQEYEKLNYVENKIHLLDPVYNIKRGFSITRQGGKVLKSINEINKNTPILTELTDGTFTSNIYQIKKRKNE